MQTFFLTRSQPATQLLTKKRPGRTYLVSITLDPQAKNILNMSQDHKYITLEIKPRSAKVRTCLTHMTWR